MDYSHHVIILLCLIGCKYVFCVLKINIPSDQHEYTITAQKGENISIQITFDTSLHSLNIYIGRQRIMHGTFRDYQFIYQSHSNRTNISIEKNPAKDFVTFVTKIMNVTYKDSQVFSIHPTLQNESLIQERKPIEITLVVYEKIRYCGAENTSTDPFQASFILCGYPRPLVFWHLGEKQLPQGNITEIGHHRYLVSKKFEFDPKVFCEDTITYKVTAFGGANLTSTVKLTHPIKPVPVVSAHRKGKCIYTSFTKTGTCRVQYKIQLVTSSNSTLHQFTVNHTDHRKICFRNIRKAIKVSRVRVVPMSVAGNTTTVAVYEEEDTHGKVIQPPTPLIIIAMLSVLLFFMFTCLASLIVLKRKEKVVREGIKRIKKRQEKQLITNGHEFDGKNGIDVKISL